MIIDDLNAMEGEKNIHYIYYATSQQLSTGINDIVHDFAFQYDVDQWLYHADEDKKFFHAVDSAISNNFVNHSSNMIIPDYYAGLQRNGVLDKIWPPTVENGLMYVCDTIESLLTIPNIQKGEFAIIGEDTYVLNMYPSTTIGNWLKLKSKLVDFSYVVGLAPSATIDTTNADNITSGLLAVNLIDGLAPSATIDTTNADNITSGILGSAYGGTGQSQ